MMRFFPHEWSLNDDESQTEEVLSRYKDFLEAQPEPVGSKIRFLVKTYSLNEALLDRLTISVASSEVEFVLVQGDNDCGYRLLTLTYSGAATREASLDAISGIVHYRNAIVRYDEFDSCPSPNKMTTPRFVHRFLLWPRALGSFAISFSDLAITTRPLDMRRYDTYGESFRVVADT